MAVVYDPTRYSNCSPDFSDTATLLNAYSETEWPDKLNPSTVDDVDYDTAMLKCITLAGYFQAKGYSTTTADYSELNAKGLKVSAATKVTPTIESKPFYDLMSYEISDTSDNKLVTIAISDNFDVDSWIDYCVTYDGVIRGDTKMATYNDNLPTDVTAVGDVFIGSGKGAIATMFLLNHYGSTSSPTLTGCVINMPKIFTANTWDTGSYKFKKLTDYNVSTWEYKYPSTLMVAGTPTNLYPLAYDGSDTHFVHKVNVPTSPSDCVNDVGGSGSIYHLVHNIHGGGSEDNCALELNLEIPTSANPFDLPAAVADAEKARKAFYVLKMNLDPTGIINGYDATSKKSYSVSDRCGAILVGSNLYITVIDDFDNDAEIAEADQATFTDVSYNSLTYKVITAAHKDYTTAVSNILSDLGLTSSYNGTTFIYAFGHVVHSFLAALFNGTALTGANTTLLIEGLPNVTRDFTNFGDISSVHIDNIWQDDKVNKKVAYTTTPANPNSLDDMSVDVLYDFDISTGPITPSILSCLHTVYGYDALINATP